MEREDLFILEDDQKIRLVSDNSTIEGISLEHVAQWKGKICL